MNILGCSKKASKSWHQFWILTLVLLFSGQIVSDLNHVAEHRLYFYGQCWYMNASAQMFDI